MWHSPLQIPYYLIISDLQIKEEQYLIVTFTLLRSVMQYRQIVRLVNLCLACLPILRQRKEQPFPFLLIIALLIISNARLFLSFRSSIVNTIESCYFYTLFQYKTYKTIFFCILANLKKKICRNRLRVE